MRCYRVRTLILAFVLATMLSYEVRAQRPLLSPRDSVELSFEEYRVFIDYGRPSRRGRVIMGGLVPFDRWWRTGANEATSFSTDVDLLMGDSIVPSGEYTLYTLPSEQDWLLIINTQTGQWGTVYNPNLDLVRIPMRRRTMDRSLEMFTITLERTGTAAGILRLRWEGTDVWVPFRVLEKKSRQEGVGNQ